MNSSSVTVTTSGRYAEKWRKTWLKQHKCVILRYISTKLGDKMYFYGLTIMYYVTLHTLLKYQQSHREGGLLFILVLAMQTTCWRLLSRSIALQTVNN